MVVVGTAAGERGMAEERRGGVCSKAARSEARNPVLIHGRLTARAEM